MSFVAIIIALQTFFIQNWLTQGIRAQSIYKEIGKLTRPFNAKGLTLLDDGKRALEEAILFFPRLMIIFLSSVSIVAVAVSAAFYWGATQLADPGIFYWLGASMFIILMAVVLLLGSYSFYLQRRFVKDLEYLKEYIDDGTLPRLEDAIRKVKATKP